MEKRASISSALSCAHSPRASRHRPMSTLLPARVSPTRIGVEDTGIGLQMRYIELRRTNPHRSWHLLQPQCSTPQVPSRPSSPVSRLEHRPSPLILEASVSSRCFTTTAFLHILHLMYDVSTATSDSGPHPVDRQSHMQRFATYLPI